MNDINDKIKIQGNMRTLISEHFLTKIDQPIKMATDFQLKIIFLTKMIVDA